MELPLEIGPLLERVVAELAPVAGRVWLYGDWVRGKAAPEAAVGIALEADRPLPLREYLALKRRIEALSESPRIEFLDLRRVRPALREAVLRQGRVIHETPPAQG
jgi:predicted nucleotidyltransferase